MGFSTGDISYMQALYSLYKMAEDLSIVHRDKEWKWLKDAVRTRMEVERDNMLDYAKEWPVKRNKRSRVRHGRQVKEE